MREETACERTTGGRLAPPSDLEQRDQARLALHRTRCDLIALYQRLPPYAVPTAAWRDPDGTLHAASLGWSEAEQAAVEKLLDRERELWSIIGTDPFRPTPARNGQHAAGASSLML